MSDHPQTNLPSPHVDEPSVIDEGGLRAPPHLKGWRKAWWWFDFLILVKLARLRFVAVLVVIGVVITQWDSLVAYYDRWRKPPAAAAKSEFEFFCPMHPAVVRDDDKEKCPICHMDLVKRKRGEAEKAASLPAGVVSRVQLTPYRIVLAGVQTHSVDYVPLTKTITAVGSVEFNERNQRTISARVAARIDELAVNETGQMVTVGDVLASLYSPELVVAMRSLLDTQRSGNADLLAGTRAKLELLGIDAKQINDILRTGQANTHLRIHSPITGHVIKKYVREGQYVAEGAALYDIADLSTVWVLAQVYEDDLPFLPTEQMHKDSPAAKAGFPVSVATRAISDQEFPGTLEFVYPHADQESRTVTIRCELLNPGHKLRPGSTATVRIHVPPSSIDALVTAVAADPERAKQLEVGRLLAVPEVSVIDTGTQQLVYRETAPGVFDGTLVELGPRMTTADEGVMYPVLKGLAAGEKIVTNGSFLIDAETRLIRGAGSIYFGAGGGSDDKNAGSVTVVRPSTPEDPEPKITAALATLSVEDRRLAEAQRFCPILQDKRLGSMGPPIKLTLNGQPVFLCCEGCKADASADPTATLEKVRRRQAENKIPAPTPSSTLPAPAGTSTTPAPLSKLEQEVQAELAKLSDAERKAVVAQQFCVVLQKSKLGSMGPPLKVMVDGKPVYVCCEGCIEEAQKDSQATLAKQKQLIDAAAAGKRGAP